VVHFTQAAALEQAQALMSVNVCTRAEKDAIADLIGEVDLIGKVDLIGEIEDPCSEQRRPGA